MKTKKEEETKPVALTDEQIVEQILRGEKQPYERLMRKYDHRFFRISMSIINDKTEAMDIMRTTYLNAYSRLSTFRNKSGFSTLLTRIIIK